MSEIHAQEYERYSKAFYEFDPDNAQGPEQAAELATTSAQARIEHEFKVNLGQRQ